MEAEVITGIPEAIYWSTVPKGIRKATSGTAQPTVGAVDVQQRSLDSAPVEAEVGKADTLPDEGTEPNLSRKRSLDSPLQNSVEGVNGDRWPKQPRLETSEGS